MKCYMCGTLVDQEKVCPHCGSDLKIYRVILASSNLLYNTGLEQAQVRDLSGAIVSLKKSLKYNKYNTKARNLLGLVYFELGETVLALSEWVISKNLEPDNPMADRYLDEIQNTPGMLDKLNQTTKKYNQALLYCKQGSRDLATIQLRKVLSLNPKFVAGHQLLALLYIQDGKYNEARKELNIANKIDVRNTTTLRYSREVRDKLKEQNQKRKKPKKDDVVSFQDGNDTIVMPNSSFRDMIDSTRASVVNILVGLVLGLLICFFLVIPTIRQRASENAAATLVDTNEELTNSASNVSSLKKKVEELNQELEKYTGKADAVGSYEKLMEAKEFFDANNLDKAGESLNSVNRDLLSARGQAMYDVIHAAVYAKILEETYNTAEQAYWKEDYNAAKESFAQVVFIDQTYHNGDALFYLAESQWNTWDFDNAKETYQKVIDQYPNTNHARTAQERIDNYNQMQENSDNASDNTNSRGHE
ncbi:MAG: tetratricopeptide repeat protein [Lachnospiraceae bacterium]